MNTVRRRGATALTAAIALALGGIPAAYTTSSILAADEASTTSVTPASVPSPVYVDAGVLILTTGTTNAITYDSDRNGTADATQGLAQGSACSLSTSGTLLNFDGEYTSRGKKTTGAASFNTGSIGVAEKKSGVSCSEVDATTMEALTLTVKASGTFGPLLAKNAHLDVDLKQGAAITAVARNSKTGESYTYYLESGSSIVPQDPLPSGITQCKASADSGPDSGANDNCHWPIDLPSGKHFDSLKLTATAGSFSLEGGADGPPAIPSTFDLVQLTDGTLCVGDSYTRDGANGAPDVTVTRLGNAAAGSASCVPYRFTNGQGTNGQFAELLKPLNSEASAQFLFEFTWSVEASESTTNSLVPMTRVDFDGPGGTADEETVLPLCPALILTTFDPDGNGPKPSFEAPVVAGVADLEDQGSGIPGTQYACVVSQSIDPATTTGGAIVPNDFTVTETIYAYGDIFLRKP